MIKGLQTTCRLLGCLALAAGGNAWAQKAVDLGQSEYRANCASCHGDTGKGGGPYVEFLAKSPTDLTLLARNNGGVFPVSRIYAVIEGAGMSHGTRDMPIWGRAYRVEAGEHYVDVPYNAEVYVRTRILALIEHLSRLQQPQ